MSAKPANRLYDGTTIHEDSHDGAARDYLEALGEPSVEVSIDGRVKKYYGREAIFRAMMRLFLLWVVPVLLSCLWRVWFPSMFSSPVTAVSYGVRFPGTVRMSEMCVSSILSRWILCLRPGLLIRMRVTTALLGTPMWSVAPRI